MNLENIKLKKSTEKTTYYNSIHTNCLEQTDPQRENTLAVA